MADLLDIAPSMAKAVVEFNGEKYDVRGLSGNAIASILARFPDLSVLLGGGGTVGPRMILQLGNSIGAIIAAGCGHLGDEQREKSAGELQIEDQYRFLEPILGLTFPNGIPSLVERLAALVVRADEGEKQKTVKVRLRTSPSPSPPSSDEASRPNMQ